MGHYGLLVPLPLPSEWSSVLHTVLSIQVKTATGRWYMPGRGNSTHRCTVLYLLTLHDYLLAFTDLLAFRGHPALKNASVPPPLIDYAQCFQIFAKIMTMGNIILNMT